MAFTGNYICTSYLVELFLGYHKHDGTHTFKLALYDNNASFTHATTDYTPTNEVSGTGYTAGGVTLTPVTPTSSGQVAFADFQDATISNATLTARGGLIYNTTADGGTGTTNAVCVLDFGLDRSKTAQDFVIQFPTPDQLNAILRIKGGR